MQVGEVVEEEEEEVVGREGEAGEEVVVVEAVVLAPVVAVPLVAMPARLLLALGLVVDRLTAPLGLTKQSVLVLTREVWSAVQMQTLARLGSEKVEVDHSRYVS
jgi:hypothetical protein